MADPGYADDAAPWGGWPGPGGIGPIRLAIDTLGGDVPPPILVRGALDAVESRPEATLTLFGDAAVITPLIAGTRHTVVHAPRQLAVNDPLCGTLRGNVDSSMRAAVRAVADGTADAVVSAGSTGALVVLSRHLIGMLPGIRRPAIIKALTRQGDGLFRMLDLGACIEASPAQLHQFALMGSAAAASEGVEAPTVALLNIGSEVRKGPKVVRAAAAELQADPRIHYLGFIEPDQLFTGTADIVVADGLTGNIALKAAEGAARMARYLLARELAGNAPGLALGRALLGGRLRRVRAACNPQMYNGASLLGLAGVVIKSHGSADGEGFGCAVTQAMGALSAAMVVKVAAGI